MALSAGSPQSTTTSRILNQLKYAMAEVASDITTAATDDVFLMFDKSDNYNPKYADATNVLELLNQIDLSGLTSTVAELNKNDDSVVILTKGSGVSSMETYASGYFQNGGVKHTRILIDLTGLVGSATDQDIIGNTGGAANCHLGQIVAAASGTIQGGSVTCLEVPAGGSADINFYSSSAATGAQDALATGLAGVATLIDAGGAWTSGATKGMTALPTANDYLYIGNGAASGGTFSAGKFLINFYGT